MRNGFNGVARRRLYLYKNPEDNRNFSPRPQLFSYGTGIFRRRGIAGRRARDARPLKGITVSVPVKRASPLRRFAPKGSGSRLNSPKAAKTGRVWAVAIQYIARNGHHCRAMGSDGGGRRTSSAPSRPLRAGNGIYELRVKKIPCKQPEPATAPATEF